MTVELPSLYTAVLLYNFVGYFSIMAAILRNNSIISKGSKKGPFDDSIAEDEVLGKLGYEQGW